MHLVIMLRHWESLHSYTCKDSGKLRMQSVPITTKVVSSNPVHGKVYLIQRYEIEVVNDLRFSPGTLVSSTNKTDSHNIVESGVKYQNPYSQAQRISKHNTLIQEDTILEKKNEKHLKRYRKKNKCSKFD